ncbi:amidase [Neobacillus drentensis]|uniref:amidase n=1 Tax=Neobacillus drentensis TaxID=220684 RepID=UPI002FFF2E73
MTNLTHEELGYMSATELAAKIREKKLSPVEVTHMFLERIEEVNPKIGAFCTVVPELALKDARQAEIAIMREEKVGPLHGVPIGIKDLTPTKGIKTTYGSRLFSDNVPNKDAVAVSRIKSAGAIVLGKTNTPEFGHKSITDNALFGRTKNPWNTQRISGGSSGGSASSVAAGLVPFAEGTDGGGSIRIPASACGVYGLKPTFGRIPKSDPINAFSDLNPFLHHGTLSRTVEDAALLYSVMVGPDPSDPFSLPNTSENIQLAVHNPNLKGLRIAYSSNFGYYEIDTQVQSVMENAVKVFESLGGVVERVNPQIDNAEEWIYKPFACLFSCRMAAAYSALLPEKEELFDPTFVKIIRMGLTYSAMDYKAVEIARSKVWHAFQTIFKDYDLLIAPTLALPPFSIELPSPPEINGKMINPAHGWALTSHLNLTGHPAASIPAGFSTDGLPIGMQIIGRRFDEWNILRASAAFEEASPWANYRPTL